MTPAKISRLMAIARAVAQLSKDDTKVGAIIIGPDGEGGPWGYNGAPRGCSADEDERFQSRPEKLFWAEHAERNAIYTAARSGFSPKGGTLVVTHFPCMDCARAIVQSGIKRVVVGRMSPEFAERWRENIIRSTQLFDETGVELLEELED